MDPRLVLKQRIAHLRRTPWEHGEVMSVEEINLHFTVLLDARAIVRVLARLPTVPAGSSDLLLEVEMDGQVLLVDGALLGDQWASLAAGSTYHWLGRLERHQDTDLYQQAVEQQRAFLVAQLSILEGRADLDLSSPHSSGRLQPAKYRDTSTMF